MWGVYAPLCHMRLQHAEGVMWGMSSLQIFAFSLLAV